MRILLIEDEERLAQALEYILKKENYIVDVTGYGEIVEIFFWIVSIIVGKETFKKWNPFRKWYKRKK